MDAKKRVGGRRRGRKPMQDERKAPTIAARVPPAKPKAKQAVVRSSTVIGPTSQIPGRRAPAPAQGGSVSPTFIGRISPPSGSSSLAQPLPVRAVPPPTSISAVRVAPPKRSGPTY